MKTLLFLLHFSVQDRQLQSLQFFEITSVSHLHTLPFAIEFRNIAIGFLTDD